MKSNKHLRIAISIWMFKPGTGGLQSHAEHLAKYLIAQGHCVTVLTRAYTRVPQGLGFLDYCEAEEMGGIGGVPVKAVNYPRGIRKFSWMIAKLRSYPFLWRLGVWLFRWQARAAINSFEGFDVIHYVGQADQLLGFVAADAASRFGVPFVVQPTCHPHVVGDSRMDISLYRKADRVLVHTTYEGEYLSQMLHGIPIDVVGNGIEDRLDGNGDLFRVTYSINGPMVLYIGRRDRDKGYGLVTEAFQELRKSRDDVVLVCMGPPGGLSKSEAAGILHFDFADEQTKHDALAACTCLCVPSEGESFGLVYMEAGRYYKPVVARKLPVLMELLENGKAGLLVGESDARKNFALLTPKVLAASLQQLLSSPHLCSEIGRESYRVSEQFIWPRVVRKFEGAYKASLVKYGKD